MLYVKPKDLKYTTMAIYVDDVVKKGKDNLTREEENKVFEYLYHLSFMLAHKHKYFNSSKYYEDFSVYFATSIMYRLLYNPKLYIYDDSGEPLMPHIKSCLNYMKSIIYGRKVAFEQENYSQKFSGASLESEINRSSYLFSKQIRDTISGFVAVDINLYLKDLGKTIKYILSDSPYKSDRILFKNIYISCLLSVTNSVTLSKKDVDNIKELYSSPEAKQNYINKVYKNNRENCVVLYHLDDSMKDYITVLVRKIYSVVCDDIKSLMNSHIPINDDVLSDIVFLELEDNVEVY